MKWLCSDGLFFLGGVGGKEAMVFSQQFNSGFQPCHCIPMGGDQLVEMIGGREVRLRRLGSFDLGS